MNASNILGYSRIAALYPALLSRALARKLLGARYRRNSGSGVEGSGYIRRRLADFGWKAVVKHCVVLQCHAPKPLPCSCRPLAGSGSESGRSTSCGGAYRALPTRSVDNTKWAVCVGDVVLRCKSPDRASLPACGDALHAPDGARRTRPRRASNSRLVVGGCWKCGALPLASMARGSFGDHRTNIADVFNIGRKPTSDDGHPPRKPLSR